jgi:type III restriction enzyme
MFELKEYQKQALNVLQDFLIAAQSGSMESAFEQALLAQNQLDKNGKTTPYRHYDFGQIPYVCLRLPTGGGKTVLASHTVKVAKNAYLEQDYPIVLWLVPTNTIREQTLKALTTINHPYRQALEQEFGLDRLRVLDIGDVTSICAQDIGRKAIIVVGTLASLRVEDTSGRKVYVYHEDFEPHFSAIRQDDPRFERVSEKDLQEHGLGKESLGKIKYSFANLLMLHRPLVIMDEAHNARTSLTFDTLKRLHPSCIVEFSATPDTSQTSASNILYRCTAAELKAEQMIKLPIILTEHEDWQAAVLAAVLTGKKLNEEAREEPDYIRPIVLFQAEAKNGAVTVEVLKAYLINELKIPESEIAVATGNQRELDGIDLFSPACLIKYIITMEALKEGWDCSFAYVFCSVKDVRSSKDAEQLLGRVLRMPFAKTRQTEALNRAYADLASPTFSQAAQLLTDKLIDMGFEAMEAATLVKPGTNQDDIFSGQAVKAVEKPLVIELPQKPEIADDTAHKVTETSTGTYKVEITGSVSEQVTAQLLKTVSGTAKKQLAAQVESHNLRIEVNKAPSMRGELFAALPQLCCVQEDWLELLEPESFLYLQGDWSLQDFPAELPQFSLKETAKNFEVDIEGEKVFYKNAGETEVYNLDLVESDITETDLIRWLDFQVQQLDKCKDITQSNRLLFLSQLIRHLTQVRQMPLTGLIRSKYLLARIINEQIAGYRKEAAKTGFQFALFENVAALETSFEFSYQFKPDNYPARLPYYQGKFKFSKHYYPIIEDLKSSGEEFECAKAIDSIPQVKYWIRNLSQREQASFRLPLANGYFYPDFVAELVDGRLLVVEYKGEVYKTNDDSREKNLVGECWANRSGGKCLFLMAVAKDANGKNVYQQIEHVIKK